MQSERRREMPLSQATPEKEGRVSEDLFATGMRIRREVLGDDYVDRALDNVGDFNRDFQRLVTEYCWGATWGRDGLSRQQRSLNNLCLLAALNRPHEFEIHFRGALRNGCSVDELRETLLQIAVYAGIPAGVDAFRIARKVLAEQETGG
jgi:4-carboxymuconolactone decarboxylase